VWSELAEPGAMALEAHSEAFRRSRREASVRAATLTPMPAPLELPPEPEEIGVDEESGIPVLDREAPAADPGRPPREQTTGAVVRAVANLIGYSIAAITARAYWALRFQRR
jgi:hypothetical protein